MALAFAVALVLAAPIWVGCADGLGAARPHRSHTTGLETRTARLPFGSVVGSVRSAAVQYLGVPYAAAPVGVLRFAPSRLFGHDGRHPGFESGQFDATSRFGPVCPQASEDVAAHPLAVITRAATRQPNRSGV